LTLLLLCAGGFQKFRIAPRSDTGPYLAAIRHAAAGIPLINSTLIGADQPVPQAAVDLLKPNVLMSRSYTDFSNNTGFAVVVVHCADARDMFAHYPPRCYAAQGWRVVNATPTTRILNGLTLPGIEYEFASQRLDGPMGMQIFNTMLLADGAVRVDMDDMQNRALADNMRWFGAGQIQIIVPSSLSPEQRLERYDQALTLFEPAIRSILSDPRQVDVKQTSVSGGDR